MKNKFPLVVIFGRTNVGKSSLFNCLTEKRQALVSKIEGTTRDTNFTEVEWRGRKFTLADTGGIIDLSNFVATADKKKSMKADTLNEIQNKIEDQARSILAESAVILFVVDNKTGLLPQDRQMGRILQKLVPDYKKKLILVANKVDAFKQGSRAAEFNKLALGEPILLSASTGAGTGDLLDLILGKLPKEKKPTKKEILAAEAVEEKTASEEIAAHEGVQTLREVRKEIRAVLIGKPNVGKSSLLNSILGEQRVIVSPIAHTTREPQDTVIQYQDKTIRLVDTAGISRKGGQKVFKEKESEKLIKYGIIKSLGRLKEVDIALLVIDANEDITHQDARIIQEIVERGKSLIIVANKWDLIEEKDTKKFTNYIYSKFPFATWAPIQFTSALTGAKTNKILDLIIKASDARRHQLTDKEAEHFLARVVKHHRPAKGKGVKHPHIFEFKQLGANPPYFTVRIGAKDDLHFSYLRFLQNRLRDKYGFEGTPIRMEILKNRKVHGRADDNPNKKVVIRSQRH